MARYDEILPAEFVVHLRTDHAGELPPAVVRINTKFRMVIPISSEWHNPWDVVFLGSQNQVPVWVERVSRCHFLPAPTLLE
jgi:hypothetical protein